MLNWTKTAPGFGQSTAVLRVPTVVLVEADPVKRERFGAWLEAAGFDVMVCPGPRAPGYWCIGGRGGPCPLAEAADVIVLDAELETELMVEGTSAAELLSYYTGSRKPVLVLGADPGLVATFEESGVRTLRRPLDPDSLVRAIGEVLLDRRDGR